MLNNKLVIDIETIGFDFESLDEISKDYFKKFVDTEEELEEAKDNLSFSPLTGEIAVIGAINPETKKGIILMQAPNKSGLIDLPKEVESGMALEIGTEKEILEKFWKIAENYNEFISFNGRSFDAPFLFIRSAIYGIRPSKNLMANRYLGSQPFSVNHIDLYDQLTFYGAVRRKFNLHFWCKAFGIQSPKEGEVTGHEVKKFFEAGKYLEIAQYNLKDLKSTAALYEKWDKCLRF